MSVLHLLCFLAGFLGEDTSTPAYTRDSVHNTHMPQHTESILLDHKAWQYATINFSHINITVSLVIFYDSVMPLDLFFFFLIQTRGTG